MTKQTSCDLDPSKATCQLLLVSIAHHEFVLPIEKIVTTAPRQELLKAPNLPPIFAGFLRHSKQLFPIIKLDTLFQVKNASYYPYTQAVIVEAAVAANKYKTFGLLVDEIIGEYTIDSVYLHRTYGHFLLSCVEYNAEISEQFYPLISPAALLEAIETYCIEQFSHGYDEDGREATKKA